MQIKYISSHLTPEVVKKLIQKEKPDSILPTLGGQAALNIAMELEESGFLKQENVQPDRYDSTYHQKEQKTVLSLKRQWKRSMSRCAASVVVEHCG